MDAGGDLHLVFLDYSANPNQLVHTRFNTNNNTWVCDREVITTYTPPTGTCGACTGTYQGAGGCLKGTFNPSIAIDDTGSPNTLVATLATNDGTLEANLKVFRSTDDGATWTWISQTSSNAYQPYVVFDRTPISGLADRFHIFSLWDMDAATTGSNFSTVSWKSTDDGQTYAGVFISGQRTATGAGGCYWGDYNAIAPDRANTGVFYGWTDHSFNPWVIRGRIMSE